MADVTVTFGAQDTGLERTLNTIQTELNQLKAEALSGELSVDQLKRAMREIGQLQNVEAQIRQMATATNELGNESQQTSIQVNQLDSEVSQLGAEFISAASSAMSLGTRLDLISAELSELKSKASTSELTVEELEKTLRRISTLESTERRLQTLANATDLLGDQSAQSATQVNNLQRELGQTTTAMGGTSSEVTTLRANFNNLAGQIAGLWATVQGAQGMFNFLRGAVSDAVDLNEAINRSNVIFGSASQSIQSWANTAATGIGQSSSAAIGAASNFAVFGRAAGLTDQELIDFSTTLVSLASDLASFQNTTPQDAITALGSALRGESEPIRRYGVLLDDATLKNRAMAEGIRDTTDGALTPGERVLAAYKEILAQTSVQQGDFARTSEELANQTRILNAEFENLSAEIGTVLVPATLQLIGQLRVMIPVVSDLVQEYQQYATITHEAGLGTTETADAAGKATGMLDLLGVMVSSVVGPITDLATGTSNYRDAANAAAEAAKNSHLQINQVGTSATTAATGLTQAGTATADLNNNLLTLSSSGTGLLSEMNAGAQQISTSFGSIETSAANTGNLLGNQTITLETINSSYEIWRGTSERINEAELEREQSLQRQNLQTAAILQQLHRTLNTGIDLKDLTFSNISGMASNTGQTAGNMEKIKTLGDEMREMQTPPAVVSMEEKSRNAKELIKQFGDYIGEDLSRQSFPDVAEKLGVRDIGATGREQIDLIVDEINRRLSQPVEIPINTDFDPSLVRSPLEEEIKLTIDGNFDPAEVRRPLEEKIVMDLEGDDFVQHTRDKLAEPVDMVFTDGLGFAPALRSNLEERILMNFDSGGFEDNFRNSFTEPVEMNLDGSQGVAEIQEDLSGPVTPQFDFADFDRQWSDVRSTINSEATGGEGGQGGQGGQGGEGGEGGDFDPASLEDVVTAINECRDRLPLIALGA
jgi:phage host-nuclease inhibitor protein Gam